MKESLTIDLLASPDIPEERSAENKRIRGIEGNVIGIYNGPYIWLEGNKAHHVILDIKGDNTEPWEAPVCLREFTGTNGPSGTIKLPPCQKLFNRCKNVFLESNDAKHDDKTKRVTVLQYSM